MPNAVIFSRGIRRIPALNALLPEYRFTSTKQAQVVVGWGLRPSTRKARTFATQHQLPFVALEDGFLRSLGLGVAGWPPLSMVVDDIGIYYDTTRPSRLERLILSTEPLSSDDLHVAHSAMQHIVAQRLSKYNHAPEKELRTHNSRPVVLLVDQTAGDMAIQYGGANADTFQQMFQTALAEHPDAEIWVKTHPDVLCGKKQGYLTSYAQQAQVRLVAEDINPISLLQQVDAVYCVTSHMGFEALLCGKPVVTFGLPWYAGWGVTDDRHPGIRDLQAQARRAPRNLPQLFFAAYLRYTRYINPNTGAAGSIFDVIQHLASARRRNDFLRGDIYCVGLSLWKRAVMKPFFQLPSCRLHHVNSVKKLRRLPLNDSARVLAWGNGNAELVQFAQQRNVPVLRMEDGFIRSVGLGSNLVPPLSLVIDDLGIYFNPQHPSRLEYILQNTTFNAQDKEHAEQIQTALLAAHISKYNVGQQHFQAPPVGRRVLLVPGQVEDDASIRSGSPQIYRNLDLLRAVRERNPHAYIIYKPHPDVVSGNRIGHIPNDECLRYADQIAAEADILTCLEHAHEVHTMTSLTGFEALLRSKPVYCYGLPFYAGWGLTHDTLHVERRTRQLQLWELVAGALMYYPSYVHPQRRCSIDALSAIDVLQQQKILQKKQTPMRTHWHKKQWNKLRHLYHSLK